MTASKAALVALVALVGTVYAVVVLNAVPPHPDLDVYLRAGKDLAEGRPLYDAFVNGSGDPALRYAFIYPPLFAIVMLPFLLLPAALAPIAWLVVTHGALALTFVIVFRRLRANQLVVLLSLLITLAFYPLWVDASQAQANLPILLLVTLGMVGISEGKSRAGIWLGVAAALKLTPGLLLIWLLVERRFRAAALMVAGFLGVTALAALLRPADSLTYARSVAPQLAGGTAYWSNQSIEGVISRLFTMNPYTTPLVDLSWAHVLVVVLAVTAIAFWVWARRGQTALTRAFVFLPLLPLASTVSWEHHLVILLPLVWLIVAVLAERGWPLGETAVATLAMATLLAIPHLPIGPPYATEFARAAHTHNPLLLAAANRLFAGAALLLVVSPWLLSRVGSAGRRWMERTPHPLTPPGAAA
ncbi:MAG TPA: glycosyltransferase family 87 protein [Candidatus Dormibacteraeota bacterium]|nr:glycosyltransferase family 87 protein [Candidatus Dormibacteraeota bacterium]